MIEIIRNTVIEDSELIELVSSITCAKEKLINHKSGSVLNLKNVVAKAVQIDRNYVFELESCKHSLVIYLKFAAATNKYDEIANYEKYQWDRLCNNIDKRISIVLPALVAFDDKSEMLFLCKIQGTTLYDVMKSAPSYAFNQNRRMKLLKTTSMLGTLLAELHNGMPFSTKSPLKYGTLEKLSTVSEKSKHDNLFRRGLDLFNKSYDLEAANTWTHGNLRTDNVFITSEGPSLIDFENAGAGNAMEDVGRLIAFILMFSKTLFFHKKFRAALVESIISGYQSLCNVPTREILVAALGEILFIYGRDFIVGNYSLRKVLLVKRLKHLIENLIQEINSECDADINLLII